MCGSDVATVFRSDFELAFELAGEHFYIGAAPWRAHDFTECRACLSRESTWIRGIMIIAIAEFAERFTARVTPNFPPLCKFWVGLDLVQVGSAVTQNSRAFEAWVLVENRESARVHNSTAPVFSGETTQARNLNLPPTSSQIVEYTDGR